MGGPALFEGNALQVEILEVVKTLGIVAITSGVGLITRKSGQALAKLDELITAFRAHDAVDETKFASHEKRLDRLETSQSRT